MAQSEYHQQIVEYYRATENAYRDSWDLDKSLAIHYGYRDEKARSFRASLQRMNEVMAETAVISDRDHVLDAGCGVGGSSIFLADRFGCSVTGITLSERQAQQATQFAARRGLGNKIHFQVMNYCATNFPDNSFDVVWGCESICYADDKEMFIREAFRLLKPGGRLVVADGFVTDRRYNESDPVRSWLDGWQVNYLETPQRFGEMMGDAGFERISYRDISANTRHSARRLYRFYWLASMYVNWRKWILRKQATPVQIANIRACRFQYQGLRRKHCQYGIISGWRP